MSAVGKSSLGAAVAFVFVSAMMMLASSEASAQINIEGLIRGAIGHGYGYRYRGGSHHRGHVASRHERRHEDSDSASSSDKGWRAAGAR